MARVVNPGMPHQGVDRPANSKIILGHTFTGVGQSSETWVKVGSVTIGGTFSGTVVLQRRDSVGNWIDVQTFTGPGVATIDDTSSRMTRFNCTSYVSGSIRCEIAQ